MKRKHIYYPRTEVYAILYTREQVIYYNMNFHGTAKVYLMI